jgi:hypothetical protein
VTAAALVLAVAAILAPRPAHAFRWPWEGDPWPSSSERPVATLDHPTVESVFQALDPAAPYRIAIFGDQRALADGEWQVLIQKIADIDRENPFAFLIDTGDIVEDGKHSDQFTMLRDILEPVRPLPYLVGIGNHEVSDNKEREARENVAAFLSYLDADFGPDRMYYRKDLGAATFLFLDTNDFTYGEDGNRRACPLEVDPGTREGEQLEWLRDQAEDLRDQDRTVITVMHHPLVQSSEKHSDAACALWNFSDHGESLADILADAGTDVVLTGHTHTYERFRMTRSDGHEMQLINISGRPRDAFLWIGSEDRRAQDIRGREHEWLDDMGWIGLDHWTVEQIEYMEKDDEGDEFAVLTVEPEGGVDLRVHFLTERGVEPGDDVGLRSGELVRLR